MQPRCFRWIVNCNSTTLLHVVFSLSRFSLVAGRPILVDPPWLTSPKVFASICIKPTSTSCRHHFPRPRNLSTPQRNRVWTGAFPLIGEKSQKGRRMKKTLALDSTQSTMTWHDMATNGSALSDRRSLACSLFFFGGFLFWATSPQTDRRLLLATASSGPIRWWFSC